jgi:hypothetical protein
MVKAYIPQKDIKEKTKWLKFMHNLQSTGVRKHKMADAPTNNNINIEKCPCCTRQNETQQHMVTCESNTNRHTALIELNSAGSNYKEHHNLVTVLTIALNNGFMTHRQIQARNWYPPQPWITITNFYPHT